MPDFSIWIGAEGPDALVRVAVDDHVTEGRLPRILIDRAAEGEVDELRLWLDSFLGLIVLRHSPSPVMLETAVPEWAAVDWEDLLSPPPVRICRVRPRILQGLSSPIRILETDGRPESDVRAPFVLGASTLEGAEAFVKAERWPTVDVLFVHELPRTAGWFLRFAELYRTRLILIESERSWTAEVRRLAQTILDRGGPAVWVFPRGAMRLSDLFLARLGDRPLDRIHGRFGGALFAGAGREDALRLSEDAATKTLSGIESFEIKGDREPRHVNVSFFGERGTSLEQLDPRTARLVPGELVHLGVQIGPKDEILVSIGSTAFLDEKIRWDEEGDHTWIDIGVTAIDFDLSGSPVQEVRLPRDAPTDLVTFAVRPHRCPTVPGVARLRVSIYYRNNVIQSFLVAALLTGAEIDAAAALAVALRLPPEDLAQVGKVGVGYLTRLEYSAMGSIDRLAEAPPRALSIVANESAGEKVVTFKGDDLFRVVVDANLKSKVQEMRAALDRASATVDEVENPVVPGQFVKNKIYRFMFDPGNPNSGDPGELLELMWDMAKAGWSLYSMLVPSAEDQDHVREAILGGAGVHAAHMDVSDVIPWSLLYDRDVFDTKHEYPEEPGMPVLPVERAVCPAGMPAEDGTMPAVECGTEQECLLHPDQNERRKRAGGPVFRCETVICPRRFWGFLTPIEVPAQQVERLGDAPPRSIPRTIEADKPAVFVAGFNPNLGLAATHESELRSVVEKDARGAWIEPAFPGRDPLRQLLLQKEPDLVYFYCHAHASLTSPSGRTIGPNLDFGHGFQGALDDVLEPPDFSGKAWKRSPLVFMNGCGTAGFDPSAPSEFIKRFIQGREASAVIGTEVTVWENLAQEVARIFFEAFLAGAPAGEALLRVRRRLLAKSNPLGLVYTLYGSADLQLVAKSNL